MKLVTSIIAVLLLANNVFGCDANCIACHPKLIKNGRYDNNHKILKNCTRCHDSNKDNENHGACGADCWSCHDIQKISHIDIKEHRVLPQCILCHESINKHLFDNSADMNNDKNLRSILL